MKIFLDYNEVVNNISESTRELVGVEVIKSLVDEFFAGVTHQENPEFYGIGGGVAAGKTYIYNILRVKNELPNNALVHDPDMVMVKIPSYKNMLKYEGAEAAQKEFDKPALEIAEALLDYGVKRRANIIYIQSFSFDRTKQFLEKVKGKGYDMKAFHGVFTDADNIAQRLKKREAETSRHFPLDEALERTAKFVDNWRGCKDLFSESNLWKNSNGDESKLVYQQNGGKGKVYDNSSYQYFINIPREGLGEGKFL